MPPYNGADAVCALSGALGEFSQQSGPARGLGE